MLFLQEKEGDDPSRVGAASNPMMDDAGLSTGIAKMPVSDAAALQLQYARHALSSGCCVTYALDMLRACQSIICGTVCSILLRDQHCQRALQHTALETADRPGATYEEPLAAKHLGLSAVLNMLLRVMCRVVVASTRCSAGCKTGRMLAIAPCRQPCGKSML